MANTSAASKPAVTSVPTPKKPALPEGYRKVESQQALDGYWLPERGHIHGKLTSAFDYRQKSGKGKGGLRRVYVLELAEPCTCTVMAEDGKGKKSVEETELPARSFVGVFSSAGLRDLDELGGTFVYIAPEMDAKTGKQAVKALESGNEMKLFSIGSKGAPKPLKIRQAPKHEEEDHSEASGGAGSGSDDELPF